MTDIVNSSDTNQQPGDSGPAVAPVPLRVALDVRFWEMSGLGTYVREMLNGFVRARLPVVWTFIGPEEYRERVAITLNIDRWIDFDAPIYSPRAFFRYPDLRDVDLFHYPHYNLPRVRARRVVTNVFDLFHLRYGRWAKRRYQSLFMTRLHWSKATLITSCAKVTRELQAAARLSPERIVEIPLGPGRPLPLDDDPTPPMLESLAGTPVRPPWLLAMGIDQPHKNIDFLIKALGLYFQRRPDAPALVWMGLSEEMLQLRAKQIPALLRPKIVLEPYSDVQRQESIFRGAGALVFPSLDEGFGLPPLEAMMRGMPVLCSRREPMTSILGDAPLYFEPTESASLWRMLDRLLDMNGPAREELIWRGRQQAARYRWEYTARQTFNLYAQIADRDDLLITNNNLLGRV